MSASYNLGELYRKKVHGGSCFWKCEVEDTQMVTAFILVSPRCEAGSMHVYTCLSGFLFPLINLLGFCPRGYTLKPLCTVDRLPNTPASNTWTPILLILYNGRRLNSWGRPFLSIATPIHFIGRMLAVFTVGLNFPFFPSELCFQFISRLICFYLHSVLMLFLIHFYSIWECPKVKITF